LCFCCLFRWEKKKKNWLVLTDEWKSSCKVELPVSTLFIVPLNIYIDTEDGDGDEDDGDGNGNGEEKVPIANQSDL
jgi:hypothetical protein